MNFTYLESYSEFSALLAYCQECECFAHSRADISITAARKATEYMIKLMYGTRITPNIHGLKLFDMLSDYDFIDYIGNRELLDAVHLIRRKGNQAVHEGNMTSCDAILVLEKLHFVIGNACMKLGIIDSYPPFDPDTEERALHSISAENDIIEVDTALLQKISALMRRRMKSAVHANTEKNITNVHVSTRKDAQNILQAKVSKGTDSGANGKTAYQHLAKYVADKLPDVQILMENVKSELVLIKDKKETVLAVKIGCATLGTKDYNEQWQILPGVDYVLYAPDVLQDLSIEKQFRLFTREEFIQLWEELGLVRFKVSTAMRKRVATLLGSDEKIPTDKYADVISIQSFSNSGKKGPLVKQKLTAYPLLPDIDLCTIL